LGIYDTQFAQGIQASFLAISSRSNASFAALICLLLLIDFVLTQTGHRWWTLRQGL